MNGMRVLRTDQSLFNLVIDLQNKYKKQGKRLSQREATKMIATQLKKRGIPIEDENFIWLG